MKDPYLLAKALAYAIVAIEARPEAIREQADYDDMVRLFRKLPASEREMFLNPFAKPPAVLGRLKAVERILE